MAGAGVSAHAFGEQVPTTDTAASTRDLLFRVASPDSHIASVRYRALMPACAMRDSGYTTALCSDAAPTTLQPRIAIGVKPLRGSDAAWVRNMRARGIPTVVDLCDNIFVEGYGGAGSGIADGFRNTVQGGLVTVPTQSLREVVIENADIAPDRVRIVPDIAENAFLLRRQMRMLQPPRNAVSRRHGWDRASAWAARGARALGIGGPILLWFGNHGARHASFGLDDLLLWEDALRDASLLGAQLWVVSNHRERFEAMRPSLKINARYFEWSPGRVELLLSLADVCLVPNSMDAFSRSKSPNRALKALAARVPVVATPTPAMLGLQGAVWLEAPAAGIRAYLEDPVLRQTHLDCARQRLERDFSMAALRTAMSAVVDEALLHG